MRIVVRLHQIPISLRTTHMAIQIGNTLGLNVEALTMKSTDYSQYMRLNVTLDLHKGLKHGLFIQKTDGSKVWVSFTYERLPNFCFMCGVIGHGEKRCPLRYEEGFDDPGEQLPYGSWLRASATKDDTSDNVRVLSWIVGGDFNEMLSNSKKEGGVPKLPSHIGGF